MSARLRKSVTRQWKKWGLKRAQMLILAYLAEQIDERKGHTWSFPGLTLICEETGFSRRWVQINLHQLEKLGAFRVDSLVGGRKHPICYYLHVDENHQVYLEPPAPVEADDVDQAQTPIPFVPWEERPLEQQLRYVRAIVNKRSRLGDERRDYWNGELKRIELEICARDAARDSPPLDVPPLEQLPMGQVLAGYRDSPDYQALLRADPAKIDRALATMLAAWIYWRSMQLDCLPGSRNWLSCQDRLEVAAQEIRAMLADQEICLIAETPLATTQLQQAEEHLWQSILQQLDAASNQIDQNSPEWALYHDLEETLIPFVETFGTLKGRHVYETTV